MRNNYIKGVFSTYPLDLKYESNLLHTKLIRVSQNHVFFFFFYLFHTPISCTRVQRIDESIWAVGSFENALQSIPPSSWVL